MLFCPAIYRSGTDCPRLSERILFPVLDRQEREEREEREERGEREERVTVTGEVCGLELILLLQQERKQCSSRIHSASLPGYHHHHPGEI